MKGEALLIAALIATTALLGVLTVVQLVRALSG